MDNPGLSTSLRQQHAATVVGAFALAGLVSAAIQPIGFKLAKMATQEGGGFLDLLLFLPWGSPSTLFSFCLLAVGVGLWKMGRLRIVSTTRRVSWAVFLLLASFPVGVVVSFIVFGILEPPHNSDGPPIEPTFLQKHLGDYAILLGILAGGFVVLEACSLSVRVLCWARPRRIWLLSLATIFGTLLVTAAFNYWYAILNPAMYRYHDWLLNPDGSWVDRLTGLLFVEMAGTMTMLFFGQTILGAVIGYWILDAIRTGSLTNQASNGKEAMGG